MKTVLFLMLSFLSIINLNAQNIYMPGKTVQGKEVAYRCKSMTKFFIKVSNADNIDTTRITYYTDGSIVPDEEGIDAVYGQTQTDLQRMLRESLTTDEWEMIKGKIGYGLTISIVADSSGNTQELSFTFRIDDPVFSRFSPDRLFQLEKKFKQEIKIVWNKDAKRMRNVKYTQSIDYRKLE